MFPGSIMIASLGSVASKGGEASIEGDVSSVDESDPST
jgi:hypothetical protein